MECTKSSFSGNIPVKQRGRLCSEAEDIKQTVSDVTDTITKVAQTKVALRQQFTNLLLAGFGREIAIKNLVSGCFGANEAQDVGRKVSDIFSKWATGGNGNTTSEQARSAFSCKGLYSFIQIVSNELAS